MSLEDTLEKTQINLRDARLTGRDVRNLLKYLASTFNCTITYNIEKIGQIDGTSEKLKSFEYPLKIGGNITCVNKEDKSIAMLQFEFEREYINNKKPPYFAKLKFNLPPGYTIEEISSVESRLIKDIRSKVKEYFQK